MQIIVDTAVVIPVNVFPLTDDTDFKTRETAVVYNQAGMDLVWNFVTETGVTSQVAVTPTTAGVHDWGNTGDAMYTLEIPASGGTINNDTEGFGWFSGVATGVLPWRGPIITFAPANIVNSMVKGSDILDVQVAGMDSGVIVPATLAARAVPNLLQATTIASLTDQTSFTLSAGSSDDDAYNNRQAVITDIGTGTQKAVVKVKDYVGSTKTITLWEAPAFTIATTDLIDILATGDSTVYHLDREAQRIVDHIERLKKSHTAQGETFYWDPENGDDTLDGLSQAAAKKTYASAYALVTANNHDVVIGIAGAVGTTIVTETIVMDKAYSFLWMPGRDMRFKPTVTNVDTVVLSAEGVEFHAAIVETAESGSRDAIRISADFVKATGWVDQSRGDGVHIEDAANCLVDMWVQDAAESGSGYGIHVKATSAPTTRNTICGTFIDILGDAIRFDGAQCTGNLVTVNQNGTHIINSSGWGVNEVNSADANFVTGPGIFFSGNTSGDVNLTGANSEAINIEQWAKHSIVTELRMAELDPAKIPADIDLLLARSTLQSTTIATLASQTSFTLTAGSADDDAYNGATAIITDQVTGAQRAVEVVSDYTGATKDIALESDPGIFTMAVGDTIDIVAVPPRIAAIKLKTDNLPGSIPRGVQIDNIGFTMFDSNGDRVTGIVPVVQVAKDSGSYTGSTNTSDEVGNGDYDITLTSTEAEATALKLYITGTGALPVTLYLRTNA